MIAPLAWMLAAGLASTPASSAPAARAQLAPPPALAVQSAYPVVVTEQLLQCRDFYTRLGFRVMFEAAWFIYLESAGNRPHGIAFMHPDHPSQPPGPERFGGKGVLMTLQVSDAATEFTRLQQAGVTIIYPLKDEPWGQRRFGLVDPAGVWVDVVEQIAPAPDYWAAYPPAG